MKRKKFTLIELIAVIVILGIVSVIAIPKYVNMQKEAADATVQGVLASAQAACALNYAAVSVQKPGVSLIQDGTELLAAMNVSSGTAASAWSADAATIKATINGTGYVITVTPSTATPADMTTVAITAP